MTSTRRCSREARRDIDEALGFLSRNASALRKSMRFHRRRGPNRRISRRVARKCQSAIVVCSRSGSPLCRRAAGRGVPWIGRRVKVCYEKLRDRRRRNKLSDLVELIAHEIGHKAGIPFRPRNHERSNSGDKVYAFGRKAKDLFLEKERDRKLGSS